MPESQWFVIADAVRARVFSPCTDPHRREHQRFAREVPQFIEQEAQTGAFTGVSIFVPSPFLGLLKAELGNGTTRRLAVARDIDLSAAGPTELDRRIRQATAQ